MVSLSDTFIGLACKKGVKYEISFKVYRGKLNSQISLSLRYETRYFSIKVMHFLLVLFSICLGLFTYFVRG